MAEDALASYERGLAKIFEILTEDHPRYEEALAFQIRLWKNIAQVRQYGDNEIHKTERLRIIAALDQLMLEAINISFNQLCWIEEGTDLADPQAVAQTLLDGVTSEPDGSQTLSLNENLAQELLTVLKAIQTNTENLTTLLAELNRQGISITGDGNIVGNHNQVIIVKDSEAQNVVQSLVQLRQQVGKEPHQAESTLGSSRNEDKQSSGELNERIHQLETLLTSVLKHTLHHPHLSDQEIVTTIAGPDSPPFPPSIYLPREELVRQINEDFQVSTWLALSGGPDKGKTQLVRAVTETSGIENAKWISLGSLEAAASFLHLDNQLVRWLMDLTGDKSFWYLYGNGEISFVQLVETIAEYVGGNGLLCVDNLPDPLLSEVLFQRLTYVALIFASYQTKLLTTSQYSLPARVRDHLGTAVTVIDPPAFSENDIREILKVGNAPEEMVQDNVISIILASTSGLPALVAATVHWFRQHNWLLTIEDWQAVMIGSPTGDIRQQERRRMVRLLDDKSRDLLYRLTLLGTNFDRTLAHSVAVIEPAIEQFGECLDELTGPWIDRLTADQYQVTPLLKDAGQQNLSEETQKQVHKIAANHYLSQGKIDVVQAQKIAMHLWGSGDYQDFATFLIHLMLSIITPSQAKYVDWATLIIPPDGDWPSEIDLDRRIMLRAAQVRTRILARGDVSSLEAELEQLIAQAGPGNSPALVLAYAHTGPLLLSGVPTNTALQRAVKAVQLLRERQPISADAFPGRFEELIWIPATRLKGLEEISEFLALVRRMTDDERRRLFEATLAIEGTIHLLDHVWMTEAEKSDDQQNWQSILQFLEEIQDIVLLPDTDPLEIAQARAKAVVLADYLEQPDAALDVLNTVSDVTIPDLLFILNYTIGCILFDAGRFAEAMSQFQTAAAIDVNAFFYYRFDARRRLAIAYSKLSEWDEAKRHCIQVIQIAKTSSLLTYDGLEMMGELAWIHWATGNRRKVCGAMYGLVTGLEMEEEITSARFREAFNKAGHGLGWFAYIAITGQQELTTMIGGEVYRPAEAGLFGVRRSQLGSYVPPAGFSKTLLLTQLGILAQGVSLARMAWKIYQSVTSIAHIDDNKAVFGMSEIRLASLAVQFGHPNEALNLGLEAAKALALEKKLYEMGVDLLDQTIKHDEILGEVSQEEFRISERQLLYLVFGPGFTNLLGTDLSKDEFNDQLEVWEEAVASHWQAFEDPEFWDEVIQILKRLSLVLFGKALREEDLDIPEDETVLKALWFLASSNQPNTRLIDSLGKQISAVDFLIRTAALSEGMFPGTAKFIHRFWVNVANTRGFALNSPQLFRKELASILPNRGASTAVKVLISASQAVGASIPKEIMIRFRQVNTEI
jgi:tetratricopeptide (TPR) repeat protein